MSFLGCFAQNARLTGGGEVALRQLVEGGTDGPGPGDHHNVPAGLKLIFIQTVNLPQSSADPVADVGLTQLFAYGDAHPILPGPVAPGVEHDVPVGLPSRPVEPLKYVVELQRTGIFHDAIPQN